MPRKNTVHIYGWVRYSGEDRSGNIRTGNECSNPTAPRQRKPLQCICSGSQPPSHCSWSSTTQHRPKRNIIFTDSQAAAKAVDNPWRQSGQSIIKRFLDTADKLQSSQSIQIIWIPGHEDIEGNERADKEAKEAAIKEPPPRCWIRPTQIWSGGYCCFKYTKKTDLSPLGSYK